MEGKWKEKGREVVRVKATIQDERSKIHEYIKKMVSTDYMLSEVCLGKKVCMFFLKINFSVFEIFSYVTVSTVIQNQMKAAFIIT